MPLSVSSEAYYGRLKDPPKGSFEHLPLANPFLR